MSEYTDIKNRKYKVKQTVRDSGSVPKSTEYREYAEREVVEALFKIFRLKAAAK